MRLFPPVYGPRAPRNASPGADRGFRRPVIAISGGQAGCEAARLWRPGKVGACRRNMCIAESPARTMSPEVYRISGCPTYEQSTCEDPYIEKERRLNGESRKFTENPFFYVFRRTH